MAFGIMGNVMPHHATEIIEDLRRKENNTWNF